MTVQNEVKKVIAPGNDTATVFSFSPMVLPTDSSELEVTLTTAAGAISVLTLGSGAAQYSVTVASYPGTGSITYRASGTGKLATGDTLTMRRKLPLKQQVDLGNQGGYFPDIQEGTFDYARMVDLQQQEEIDRCPKIPSSVEGVDMDLPTPVA